VFRVAPEPSPLVARDRLTTRLVATGGARVVLLGAPAGYGKTTLLRAWAAADPRPFRWLPARRTPLVPVRADPCVLVLDGWPAADAAAAVEEITAITAGGPSECVFAIAARAPGALPLGRLRAARAVLELGPAELAMTRGEAHALLGACGLALDGRSLDALLATTAGWPALLSLAAQSVTGTRDPGAAAAGFGGDDPFAAAYVADELLARASPRTRRFLRRSSVLEELDAEACDAVLGGADSAAMLHRLEHGPLPVARTDRTAIRLRCHPLLRQVLRADLRRCDPGLEVELHRRASHWFEERDDLDAAIRHALAGDDVERAGELLWRGAAGYAWDGRAGMLDRWLRRLPEHAIDGHATLALTAAMSDLSDLALADAARRGALAEQALARAPRPLRRSLRAGGAVLTALAGHGDVTELRALAARGSALAGGAEPARALGRLLDGAGALLAGDDAAATAALEDGVRRAAVSASGIAALCEAELALGALCAGDFDEGSVLAERARSRVDAAGLDARASFALVAAVAAFARAHRRRFAEARVDVEIATRMLAGADDVPPWYGAQARLALARAHLRLSDAAGARGLLADARRDARRLPGAAALSAWLAAAWAEADAFARAAPVAAEPLTASELRVLGFLPSHLTFREIGEGTHLSANTIKSQAHAVYRKLGATSRSVAVARARELGLLS
jgi:LuxR family transcriptional regulator, maltose regulon positive regulatory protein